MALVSLEAASAYWNARDRYEISLGVYGPYSSVPAARKRAVDRARAACAAEAGLGNPPTRVGDPARDEYWRAFNSAMPPHPRRPRYGGDEA